MHEREKVGTNKEKNIYFQTFSAAVRNRYAGIKLSCFSRHFRGGSVNYNQCLYEFTGYS